MFQQGQILAHSTLTRQHQDGITVKNLKQDFYEESDPEVQYEFRRDSCFTTWNTATLYSGTTAIC